MSSTRTSELDAQLFEQIQKQFLQPTNPFQPPDKEQSFEEISESPIKADLDDEKKLSQRWKFCCDRCKKQDKGTGRPKTCVCIVPASQRRIKIGKKGCQTCGCRGCSIEDLQMKKKKKKTTSSSSSDVEISSDNSSRSSSSVKKRKDKRKKSKKIKKSSPTQQDLEDLNNLSRSHIGLWLQALKVNPNQIGFGIPQRTHSYIYGTNEHKRSEDDD